MRFLGYYRQTFKKNKNPMKRLFASLNITQTRHFFFLNKYTHFLLLVQTFLKELFRFFLSSARSPISLPFSTVCHPKTESLRNFVHRAFVSVGWISYTTFAFDALRTKGKWQKRHVRPNRHRHRAPKRGVGGSSL